jgi:hypothetical protein
VLGTARYRGNHALKLTFTNPLCGVDHVERMLARLSSAANDLHAELSSARPVP